MGELTNCQQHIVINRKFVYFDLFKIPGVSAIASEGIN